MFRHTPIVALLILALVAACAAPAASPSPAVSGTPTASLPSPTASPSRMPRCSDVFADAVTNAHSGDTEPDDRATDALADARHDGRSRVLPAARSVSGGEVVNEPTLVPVLRTVPRSTATATAAMKALLAGPSAKERAAKWQIKTLIPAGSKLLGIEISGGLATVDLSAEFASLSPDDVWDAEATRSTDVWPRSSTP